MSRVEEELYCVARWAVMAAALDAVALIVAGHSGGYGLGGAVLSLFASVGVRAVWVVSKGVAAFPRAIGQLRCEGARAGRYVGHVAVLAIGVVGGVAWALIAAFVLVGHAWALFG